MSHLYSITQTSKQALHQFLQRQSKLVTVKEDIILQGDAIRKRHPSMGCRNMYQLMVGIELGRDRCEEVLMENGFRVKRSRKSMKTTDGQKHLRFPDLIKGRIVTGINQVWQTDITFYLAGQGSMYYIVFIEDIYSRRIIGWSANEHLRAEANIECFMRAIEVRNNCDLAGLIHHSDRGSQYGHTGYLSMLKERGIRVSMCKQAWHNAYTERINGTIKNGYLYCWDIETLRELRKALNRAVEAYNTEKPHKNLPGRMSPVTFEKYLETAQKKQHPIMKIYNYS
jgi:putative transposase